MARKTPQDHKPKSGNRRVSVLSQVQNVTPTPSGPTKSSFKLTDEVHGLDYDFRPDVDAHGTIPEPTGAMIREFRHALTGAFAKAGLVEADEEDGEMVLNVEMVDQLMGVMDEVEDDMVAAVADVTGIPAETLNQLGYRGRSAFIGWITGVFMSPEALTPGMN